MRGLVKQPRRQHNRTKWRPLAGQLLLPPTVAPSWGITKNLKPWPGVLWEQSKWETERNGAGLLQTHMRIYRHKMSHKYYTIQWKCRLHGYENYNAWITACAIGLVHKLLGLFPGEVISPKMTVGSSFLVHWLTQLKVPANKLITGQWFILMVTDALYSTYRIENRNAEHMGWVYC